MRGRGLQPFNPVSPGLAARLTRRSAREKAPWRKHANPIGSSRQGRALPGLPP
jgi:hypothetical protein